VSGRAVPLTTGSRQFVVHTHLSAPALEQVLLAGNRAVASTAPLVVFGSELDLRQAALEFNEASVVLPAGEEAVHALLAQVLDFLDRVDQETPAHGVSLEQLLPGWQSRKGRHRYRARGLG
jgi:hypothetical protein